MLATVRLGKADYLVTGDKGLLALESSAGAQVVTPRQFADLLGITLERKTETDG